MASQPSADEAYYLGIIDRNNQQRQAAAASMNAVQDVNPPQARADANLAQAGNMPTSQFTPATRQIAQIRSRQAQVQDAVTANPRLAAILADPYGFQRTADDLHTLTAIGSALDQAQAQQAEQERRFGVLQAPHSPAPTVANFFRGVWQNFTSANDEAQAGLNIAAADSGINIGPDQGGSFTARARQFAMAQGESSEHFNRQMYGNTVIAPSAPLNAQGRAQASAAAQESRRQLYIQSQMSARGNAEFAAHLADPQYQSWYGRALYSGASGVAQMAPGIAASVGTGSPIPALIWAGGQTGASAYGRYRARGATPGEAATGAAIEGGVGAIASYLPMRWAVGQLGRVGLGSYLSGLIGREVPAQVVQGVVDDATDTAIANPTATWGDFIREQPDHIIQSALTAVVQSALTGGFLGAAHEQARAADDAHAMGSVDQVMGAAANSIVRRESPQDFHHIVDQLAQGSHAENLYVPAEAVRSLFQTPEDLAHDPFWSSYSDQIEEAHALGGDVVVPLADAATYIAGTPQWEQLRDHVRATPDGMSLAQARDSEATFGDTMRQAGEQTSQQMEADQAAQAPVQQVYEAMRDKLMHAGARPDVASHMATLFAQRQRVRAERTGAELRGDEADQVEIHQRDGPEAEATAIGGETEPMGEGHALDQAAYHGSPHIFDKFSLEHIGSGEGAQVYGHGLYFAGRKEIAQHYRDTLSQRDNLITIDGDRYTRSKDGWRRQRAGKSELLPSDHPESIAAEAHYTYHDAKKSLAEDIARAEDAGSERVGFANLDEQYPIEAARKALEILQKSEVKDGTAGRLYHVDIPEDHEYLDWDKPLSEQSDHVKEALDRLIAREPSIDLSRASTGRHVYQDVSTDLAVKSGRKDLPEGNGWSVVNPSLHRGDALASRALRDAGIAGIRYLDAGSRSVGEGAHNYVVFDDNRIAIKAFDQTYGEGVRGRIEFTHQGKSVIDLFQSHDLSTALHEFGHHFLEELRQDAALPGANDQVKGDWETISKWFSANGQEVDENGNVSTESHEMFARGFERYLMEGKAPSSALRRAFEAFRSWLLNIYRVVDNLRSPITPEIRDVMQRMLATDDEIAMARDEQNIRALFKTADEAGMTKAEFDAYTKATERARDDAHTALLGKVMASVKRQYEDRYKGERNEIEGQVKEEVDSQPVFRALDLLGKGKLSDEGRVRLSRQWLLDTYGDDALSRMPNQKPLYTDDHPANADDIAEQTGFQSGDDMVRALMAHEQSRQTLRANGDKRMPRQVLIDEETSRRFADRYGDPMRDGSIEDEARALIHNDKQGDVIAAELKALNRKRRPNGSPQTPLPYEIARRWAADKISAGRAAEVLSGAALQQYERAARKAGRLAEEAMLKGDVDETYRQKQAQMLNTALISEAKKAKDIIDAGVTRMSKIAARRTMASVDQDYLDRAHALLEQVDFSTRSQRDITKQESFEAWAAQQRADGHDIVVPDTFSTTLGQTHWSRLSVEQLKGLDDTVKQIIHLGRMKQTLLDGKEQRDFNEVVEEVRGDGEKRPPHNAGPQWDPGPVDRFKARVADRVAEMLTMETICNRLDNGDVNGPFNRLVFRPISEAEDNEHLMMTDIYGQLREAAAELPKGTIKRWGERVTVPELRDKDGRPVNFTRQRLIAMALNTGNEGNMQRLTDGYRWRQEDVMTVLNREMKPEEWHWVQKTWDILDTLYPHLAEVERRVNGITPEKIEASPVETSAGTLRGGYYPAIYDRNLSDTIADRAERQGDLFEAGYTRASTRAGSANERAQSVKEPILLDISGLQRHVGEVIHDVTHREAVINANKFITDPRIKKVVTDTLGPAVQRQMRPWLKYVANSWNIENRDAAVGWTKWVNRLRSNATMFGLGFRLTTILTRVSAFANAQEAIGGHWLASAASKMALSPAKTINFVLERSEQVKNRVETLDRDIRLNLEQAAGKHNIKAEVQKYAFHMIGFADRMVSVPTWLAAYNKAMHEGLSEEDARYAGDKAVRIPHGSGAPKDMSALVRDRGVMRLFTSFYTYQSALFNRMWTLKEDVRQASHEGKLLRATPGLLARSWWLFAVAPIANELLAGLVSSSRMPDQNEDWGTWSLGNILSGMLAPIPFVRDGVRPLFDTLRGGHAQSYELSPIQRVFENVINLGKDAREMHDGRPTRQPVRDVLDTVAGFTGLPPGQVGAAAQFMVNVGNGHENPQDVMDWYHGVTEGHSHPAHPHKTLGDLGAAISHVVTGN